MNLLRKLLFLFIAFATLAACEKVDNTRIPGAAVYIPLDNFGLWNTYGVSGYGQNRSFIKENRVPSNFSYTAMTYTGFGGVLLISGYNANTASYDSPLAYDLACPVEAQRNVRVTINSKYEAECHTCGSRFNVCEGSGAPIYGEALERRFGLQRYNVIPSALGGYTITR